MRRRRRSRTGRMALLAATMAATLLLQGCNATDPVPEHMRPPPGHGPFTGTVADWPLWFAWHQWGAYCYSVRDCQILYGGIHHGTEHPQPSIESLGYSLEDALWAGNGPVRNFPPPAKVAWTSLDGTRMAADVDIGEIFADRLVRHTVPREDIMENADIPYPGIILVLDDRTISIYMSTWIPLKESRFPGNPVGNLHTGVVLVHSQTY